VVDEEQQREFRRVGLRVNIDSPVKTPPASTP
jgi:hypothetical protein